MKKFEFVRRILNSEKHVHGVVVDILNNGPHVLTFVRRHSCGRPMRRSTLPMYDSGRRFNESIQKSFRTRILKLFKLFPFHTRLTTIQAQLV